MATIGTIIRQLLEERKRVILPGFGNLEISESGGPPPAAGKRIDPPGLNVRFDSSFSKDDGLLAEAMAESGELEKEEAGQQVLELVDAIKFALDKGEPYNLEGAGTFMRDDDGKVHFTPDPEWVLDPDQYGLESMELLELEDTPGEDGKHEPAGEPPGEPAVAEGPGKEAGEKDKKPVEAPRHFPPPPPPEPAHEPWKREKEKPRRRVSKAWRIIWGIAGVLIVALLVLILVPVERFDLFGSREKAGQEVTVEEGMPETGTAEQAGGSEASAGEEGQAAGDQAGEESMVTEVETGEEGAPVQQEEEVTTHRFYIIAGSFKHLGNASELQDRLRAKGYPVEIMVTENRMYRVSVASYDTRAEAERGLREITSVPGLKTSWLLSNE